MEVGRAFVAVVPPLEVLDAVERLVARLRGSIDLPRARWTTRAQWHVTLQFLGAVDDLDAVVGAVGGACASRTPFTVRLGGGGAFPSARRASVLWLGAVEGGDAFAALADAVGSALRPLGHEPDDRPFHPHLTLARFKRAADARPLIGLLGDGPVGPAWTASEVVVFESLTRPDGAEHVERARLALRGA